MFGKVLGAIVGLAVGLLLQGWLLALLFAAAGAFVGHRYDELHAAPEPGLDPALVPGLDPALPEPQSRAEIDAQSRAGFARHLCTLFAEVAQVDGEVVQDEVRVVREYFETQLRFSSREMERVRVSLKAALDAPGELDAAVRECAEELPGADRLLLLSALYELALADGPLRRSERETIQRIASGLRLSVAEQRSVAAVHLGDGEEHFARLGLTPDASDEQIRSAFRRLAALHHPDKVAHLGPGAVELASRRFREIRDAFDGLRRLRGF